MRERDEALDHQFTNEVEPVWSNKRFGWLVVFGLLGYLAHLVSMWQIIITDGPLEHDDNQEFYYEYIFIISVVFLAVSIVLGLLIGIFKVRGNPYGRRFLNAALWVLLFATIGMTIFAWYMEFTE